MSTGRGTLTRHTPRGATFGNKAVCKVVERNTRPSAKKRAGSRRSQYSEMVLHTLRSAAKSLLTNLRRTVSAQH